VAAHGQRAGRADRVRHARSEQAIREATKDAVIRELAFKDPGVQIASVPARSWQPQLVRAEQPEPVLKLSAAD